MPAATHDPPHLAHGKTRAPKRKLPPWNPFNTRFLLPKGPVSLRRHLRKIRTPHFKAPLLPVAKLQFPMDPRFSENPRNLRAVLRPAVYEALTLPRHTPWNSLLDPKDQPHAFFGHQILLATPKYTCTTFAEIGMALAAAGRSANIPYKDPTLWTPLVFQLPTISKLREDWAEACTSFASAWPPTSHTLTVLWNGIKFIMGIRARRAKTWGCPSVLAACNQQLIDLSSIENLSLKLMSAQPEPNRVYPYSMAHFNVATLFLPFWSEHILGLGQLSMSEFAAWAFDMTLQLRPKYVPPPSPTTTWTVGLPAPLPRNTAKQPPRRST